VQNRFPFPSDLAPVDLIMHITTSEVGFITDILSFTSPLSGLTYRMAATIAGGRARSRCAMERAYERIHRTIVSLAHSCYRIPSRCSAFLYRLMKDPAARPIPRDMLDHPWFSKASKKKVDMAQWIGEVWNWDTPTRDS
jgi:hypothetical protein